MKILILMLAAFSCLRAPLIAELAFETRTIEDSIDADVNNYAFTFKFLNNGGKSVRIENIVTACGCTVAKSDKDLYLPGESGEIKGIFTVGDRTGFQEKEICLMTDDLGQSKIKLLLKVTVRKSMDLKPALLFWEKGAGADKKSVSVAFNNCEFAGMESDGKNFKAEVSSVQKSKKSLAIEVTPASTENACRGILKIRAKAQNKSEKVSIVHLLVK